MVNPELHCFNCNKSSHYQKDCKNPPYCYCCRRDGHKISMCPENKGLRVCGFGLPGQGFYNIRATIKEGGKKGARGVMTILQGAATIEMIRTELRALFTENVDWEITKLSTEKEFMIVFPNDDKRHHLARIKNFEFETANIKA